METAMKVIPPLSKDLVDYVRTLLKMRLAHKPKPDTTYQSGDVFYIGNDDEGHVVLTKDYEVLYFVRYKKVGDAHLNFGRQVLLWRCKDSDDVVGGFAQKIFFNYLLPKYGSLIADEEQTKRGQAFWQNAMVSAQRENLFVYMLDRRNSSPTLTRLRTEEDRQDASKVLWGSTDDFMKTFAIISKNEIKI